MKKVIVTMAVLIALSSCTTTKVFMPKPNAGRDIVVNASPEKQVSDRSGDRWFAFALVLIGALAEGM